MARKIRLSEHTLEAIRKSNRERSGPVEITLPLPPSANRYWRHSRGITHLSSEARAYRRMVAKTFMAIPLKDRRGPLSGPVRLTLRVYRARKAGDLVNFEKVLSDSLQGLAFRNDSQIAEAHLYRFDDKLRPRVEVLVEAL